MKKSNREGFKLFGDMGLLVLTACTLHKLDIFSSVLDADNIDQWQSLHSDEMIIFSPLHLFYGFQT